MSEDDLRQIETALRIALPISYRRLMVPFPVPALCGNADTDLWDDAGPLIARNLELRNEFVRGHRPWPEHWFFIGDPLTASGNAIDLRDPSGPVFWIDHCDLETVEDASGKPFEEWLRDWTAAIRSDLEKDGIDPDNEPPDGLLPASDKAAPAGGTWKRCGAALVVAAGLGWMLATMIGEAREAAARSYCNLGGIGLALHNYHDTHGTFPPAVVYSPEGEPLVSWRVLILPWLGEGELYKEFRLDEPWDSEHNLRLLERMPNSFAAPWTKYVDVPPGHTVCKVLVGPGTPFEGRDGVRLPDLSIDDGSETLLFVEAGEPSPWTKPEDIAYDPGRPVRLRGLFRIRNGFRAYGLRGGYRFVDHDTDQETLHRLMTLQTDGNRGGDGLRHQRQP